MAESILRYSVCADVENDPVSVSPPAALLMHGGHVAVLCSETTPYAALHVIVRAMMSSIHVPAIVVLHPRAPTRREWAQFTPSFGQRMHRPNRWWSGRPTAGKTPSMHEHTAGYTAAQIDTTGLNAGYLNSEGQENEGG